MTDGTAKKLATSGFHAQGKAEQLLFARAVRKANGLFDVAEGMHVPDMTELVSREWGLTLRQALDWLDDWERRTALRPDLSGPVHDVIPGMQNFRDFACRKGIPVGPAEKSRHHANRAKRAFLGHRRMKGPAG